MIGNLMIVCSFIQNSKKVYAQQSIKKDKLATKELRKPFCLSCLTFVNVINLTRLRGYSSDFII